MVVGRAIYCLNQQGSVGYNTRTRLALECFECWMALEHWITQGVLEGPKSAWALDSSFKVLEHCMWAFLSIGNVFLGVKT